MILLVHSCDGRKAFLDIWQKCFERSGWKAEVIYIKGNDCYADQLLNILPSLDCEYLWHMNDDYFIIDKIPWDFYSQMAEDMRVDALRMQPNVQFNSLPYRFRKYLELFRQTNDSAYQISLNCSIWRREFFIDCLTPGLDPWQLENSTKINNWNHKIYFVPGLPFWYINGTKKGTLTKRGEKIVNDLRLRTASKEV